LDQKTQILVQKRDFWSKNANFGLEMGLLGSWKHAVWVQKQRKNGPLSEKLAFLSSSGFFDEKTLFFLKILVKNVNFGLK